MKFSRNFREKIKNEFKDKEYFCIFFNDLVLFALFKFPKIDLNKSVSVLFGVVKSMKIRVVLK